MSTRHRRQVHQAWHSESDERRLVSKDDGGWRTQTGRIIVGGRRFTPHQAGTRSVGERIVERHEHYTSLLRQFRTFIRQTRTLRVIDFLYVGILPTRAPS